MKYGYNFYVKQQSEIDFHRVLREADGKNVVFIDCEPTMGVLAIRKSYLNKFNASDGLLLGGVTLGKGWGWGSCDDSSRSHYVTDEWRGWWVANNEKDLDKIKTELAAARAQLTRQEVRVTYL